MARTPIVPPTKVRAAPRGIDPEQLARAKASAKARADYEAAARERGRKSRAAGGTTNWGPATPAPKQTGATGVLPAGSVNTVRTGPSKRGVKFGDY